MSLTLIMVMSSVIPVFADTDVMPINEEVALHTMPGKSLPRLVDEADVLTETEEADILAKLDAVSEKHNMDVVVAIVDKYDKVDVDNSAYDYYDYNGFKEDGILLYLSMDARDWCLSGSGFGIEAFTDYGRDAMMERILIFLGGDDYYEAFNQYALICDDYISQAKAGTPYDVDNVPSFPETPFETVVFALSSLFIPLVLAFVWIKGVVIRKHRRQLISLESVDNADNYEKAGSFKLTVNEDRLVDTQTTRVYRPKNDSNGGGKGGSTKRKGSSGRSHSSSSGKF